MKCLLLFLTACVAGVIADDASCRGGYALELRPAGDSAEQVGRGEYQLDIRNLTSGPGIYRLSAWVRYSSSLQIPPGNRTLFHARFYAASGAEIGSGTNLVYDEELWPSVAGTYQHLQLEFDTGDKEPARIEWYVGYPLLLDAGWIRMTGVQVEGPDGRRYVKNGDFIDGQDIEYYSESNSYGEFVIRKDFSLPCVEARRYLATLSSEFWPDAVKNIPFIARRLGDVGAAFEVRGSFRRGTFGSLTYFWHEVEDAGPASPNRVYFLDNVLCYFDANGFITTPSPKNLIVTDDMLPDSGFDFQLSGFDFFSQYYYKSNEFYHSHLAIPGLRYDFEQDTIRPVFHVPVLGVFNYDSRPDLEDDVYFPVDLTFGYNQPSTYVNNF